MDVVNLKKQIQTSQLNNFYIFTGPEIEVQRVYIDMMAKVTNSTVNRVYDVSEILSKLDVSKSLLKMRQICVLRDCKDFLSSDKLQAKFERFRASESNDIIILIYDSLDKRLKVRNKFQENIIEFEYMRTETLVKYIQQKLDLTDRLCEGLTEICDCDYSRILLEVDKIQNYIEATSCNASEAFKQLLDAGVIYQSPQDTIFEFINAVLKGKITSAYKLLDECREYGENTLAILSVLYTNTKQLLQCQSYDGKDIEKATGLTSWQVKCAKDRFNNYTNGELVYLMKLIQKCESGIKSGLIDEYIVIDYILVNLWG